MNSKQLLIFLFHFFNCIIYSQTQLFFTPPFTIIAAATDTAFFIEDSAHNKFVLKYHPRGPKRPIHEKLGVLVGMSINININEVEIFSPQDPFNTLFDAINCSIPPHSGITTLHSYVPGIAVKK